MASAVAGRDGRKSWLVLLPTLAALVLVSTLPRAFTGYGCDMDAWGNAQVAARLHEHGAYSPLRHPGTPLLHYILALFLPSCGNLSSNLFAFASFLLSVLAFWLLAASVKHRLLLTCCFGLTPILLKNAVATMDYMPGLAATLWAFVLARKEYPILAGLLAGLAIGFRLSNSMLLVPLGIYLLWSRASRWRIAVSLTCALSIGLACYAPVVLQRGIATFRVPVSQWLRSPSVYALRTLYNYLMLLGPLATVGLFGLALAGRKRIVETFRCEFRRSPSLLVEVLCMLLFGALFLRLSDEIEYLIPAIPFLYLFVARWTTRGQLIIFTVLVISFALVRIEFKGGRSGYRSLVFKPTWGIVVQDFIDRAELEQLRRGIAGFDRSARAAIVTGMKRELTYENRGLVEAELTDLAVDLDPDGVAGRIHRIRGSKTFLFYAISEDNLKLLNGHGYDLFAFSHPAPVCARYNYGYDIQQTGATTLEVHGTGAFYAINKAAP